MEVTQQYSCFTASDDQDNSDQEQKAKHVIKLMRPDRIEDEEELDEDATERQDSTHQDTRCRTGVDQLRRYLPRDLIGTHWVLDRLKKYTHTSRIIIVTCGNRIGQVAAYIFQADGLDHARYFWGSCIPTGIRRYCS